MAEDRLELVNAHLPAAVRRLGGPVARVLSENFPKLTPTQIRGIGMVVQLHPRLNNEHAVDVLGWSATFHGVDMEPWFAELIEEWGLPRVHLAIECMYDLGIGKGIKQHIYEEDVEDGDIGTLEDVLAMLDRLSKLGHLPATSRQFGEIMVQLGSWESAKDMGNDTIYRILSGDITDKDVREPSPEDDDSDESDKDDEEDVVFRRQRLMRTTDVDGDDD